MEFFDWDMVHPIARPKFMALADDLAKAYGLNMTRTLFRPFEGFRSPADQLKALRAGKSKAGPFQSPHAFGLAVDFVPKTHGKWSWEGPHDWEFLARAALARGLECQTRGLEWDKPHVQHPQWHRVKAALIPQISGSAA